jgi:protein involved in polysaccharide export with SLBB domain
LLVQIDNIPEVRQLIDADGDISLPFGVKLHVAGKTLVEIQRAISAAYPPEPVEVSVSLGVKP